jgi:hypothetical protein
MPSYRNIKLVNKYPRSLYVRRNGARLSVCKKLYMGVPIYRSSYDGPWYMLKERAPKRLINMKTKKALPLKERRS